MDAKNLSQVFCWYWQTIYLINRNLFLLTIFSKGSELVDWMVENNHVSTRADAVAIGQTLLMNQVFMHVTKDHPFKDEHLFYRFKVFYFGMQAKIAKLTSW